MNRKDVGIKKVYDARALRVIVGDKNGTLHGQAVQCCYNLLNIIHRYTSTIFLYILYIPFQLNYLYGQKSYRFANMFFCVQNVDAY